MYAKIFRQIYDSTLANDWQSLIVFQQFLILSDYYGVVDMTPEAISRITNIPLDIIKTGIEKLEAPDNQSRSDKEEGRRIAILSNNRNWGWQIVNYSYYRELSSKEDKREKDRLNIAEKRKMSQDVVNSRNVSQDVVNVAHTDTHTDTDTDTKKKKKENTYSVEVEKKHSTSTATEWPENDLIAKNLKDFLLKQTYFKDKYQQQLLHYEWWDNLSTVINGIDIKWIDIEFAKMRKWIIDNPKRTPTVKGFRKFVGGWLERGYEKERRFKT